jgi:dTDP-4-dehydrorhamnose reductase
VKTAVTGAHGMLGTDVIRLIGETEGFELAGVFDLKDGFDLLDRPALHDAMASHRPDVVINCAAYTNVDGAETERIAAFRGNRDIPGILGGVAKDLGFRLIHVSSDYVFDGEQSTAYGESDPPSPQSVYGRSKLEGDRSLLASGCNHAIVRSAWLYGRSGKNFVDRIIELAAGGGPLKVVKDQRGCPTWTVELARALLAVAPLEHQGVVNFACSGNCSWFEFAREITRQAGMDVAVLPLTTAELGRPAHRPPYSVLDTSLFEKLTGLSPLPWEEALRQYLSTGDLGG